MWARGRLARTQKARAYFKLLLRLAREIDESEQEEDAGLTSIGNEAFGYCSSLESVSLPDGLTSIGDGAFMGCSALRPTELPATVVTDGSRVVVSSTRALLHNARLPPFDLA